MPEPKKLILTSTPLIYTPNTIKWLQHNFHASRDFVVKMMKAYNEEHAETLADKVMAGDYKIVNDTVEVIV